MPRRSRDNTEYLLSIFLFTTPAPLEMGVKNSLGGISNGVRSSTITRTHLGDKYSTVNRETSNQG